MTGEGKSNFEHADLDAMLDFSFRRFLTIKVVRIAYLVGLVLIALSWFQDVVIQLNRMVQSGIYFRSLLAILVVTVALPVYVLLYRVALELVVVLFRIGENTVKTQPTEAEDIESGTVSEQN